MKKTVKIFSALLGLLVLATGVIAGGAWYWAKKQPVAMSAERIDYVVPAGSGPRAIARSMQQAGMDIQEDAFVWMARFSGLDTSLQAGAYEAVRGDTPWAVMERMSSGNMLQTRLTIPEGWTYQRIRDTLAGNPQVRQTLGDVSDADLLTRLGVDSAHPEGMFYPDTYVFVPGTADIDIMRRGFQAQQELLEQLWADRDADLPLKTPYEALIMASIVERETGHSQDRARVAGVFMNRLRVGMPLQTDPTVIYGMGSAYDGRIRKRDLTTDTPWNTYTRNGLPPTPIASPGKASLMATLHPEKHNFYYFVSRGDGTSEFSANLAAHNRAVAKYILKR